MPDPTSILISGGNGAIARATAREFLENDAALVYLGIRNNCAEADLLAEEFGDRCRVLPLDVTNPEAWEEGCGRIIEDTGRLDVLINHAGGHDDALLAFMEPEAWTGVIEANLTSVFHGCRAAVRSMMRQRYGRIVNVSSLSALLAPAGQTNYAAAKAGVVAFSQSLAKEVARSGVTVNVVCPGYIDTSALDDAPGEVKDARLQQIPMRRLGRPGEVASAIRFLASPAASYITGAVLKIDGGIM